MDVISILLGDIVAQSTDAIVNAANEMLAPGSGVSGAIHAAAGRYLDIECSQLGGCPTGEARITLGYNLNSRYVIHAVAPRYWDGTRGEADALRRTYSSIFDLAIERKLRSISIPAIGTGIYRYPIAEAAKIAFDVARRYSETLDIVFVCFDQNSYEVYKKIGGGCADFH